MWQMIPVTVPLLSTMGLAHFGKAQQFPLRAKSLFTVEMLGSATAAKIGSNAVSGKSVVPRRRKTQIFLEPPARKHQPTAFFKLVAGEASSVPPEILTAVDQAAKLLLRFQIHDPVRQIRRYGSQGRYRPARQRDKHFSFP